MFPPSLRIAPNVWMTCVFSILYDTEFLGLYFKLHGTHRPNSMKKTVIKRRKRVPAAPGSSSPTHPSTSHPMSAERIVMSDQAAAEVLASVGRAPPRPGSAGSGRSIGGMAMGTQGRAEIDDGTESEEDAREERPRRKRARKSRGKEGDEMEVDEPDEGSSISVRGGRGRRSTRGGRRSSNPSNQPLASQAPAPGQQMLGGAQGPWDGSMSLAMSLQMAAQGDHSLLGHTSRPGSAFSGHHTQDAYGMGARGNPFAPTPAHHQPGFDSLQDPALRELMNVVTGSGAGYVRGSGGPFLPPSRGHSPLSNPPLNAYGLPTHPSALGSHPFFPGGSSPKVGLGAGNGNGVPTIAELERHYSELAEEKRRMQEMIEKTDRIMAGLKRGLDEMKGISTGEGSGSAIPANPTTSTGSPSQVPPLQESPAGSPVQRQAQVSTQPTAQPSSTVSSVPLPRTERSGSKEKVWPIVGPSTTASASGGAAAPTAGASESATRD
ncbi:hypothetical protein NLI96_g555 [Meripilus lineatus]|uniref:GATA-type domain-containing protein n=1 Tax=Meripilus lineatus TaxID=2056292 RepID=A0AAD5VGB5_9APHY|nr:hypothetical protein NLI96_g555 [Physisporinus lineatus]